MLEEPTLSSFWESAVRYGPAVIVALFYVTIVLHYSYTPDKTYVYLQYAKNVANGDGFGFNANSPTNGVVSPLWVLLIAAGAKAGLDPFIVAKTFDILFASLSIVLVYTFSSSLIQDRLYGLFAALVFSLDAWFLRWSGTGMETSFAIILVLLTVKYAYSGDYHIAGFVAGLLTLVRPEGMLLFLVIQAENFVVAFVVHRSKTFLWTTTLVYCAVVVPWMIYAYDRFGSVVPNAGLSAALLHWSIKGALGSLVNSALVLGSTQLIPVVLIILGVPIIIRQGGIGTFVAKGMPILWIIAIPFVSAFLGLQFGTTTLAVVSPLVVVYAFWTLKDMELSKAWFSRKALVILGSVACLTILQSQIVYRMEVVPYMKAFAAGMERSLKPIALWLRTNTDPDASVLTPDVGLVGYVSERRVFDAGGSMSPEIAQSFQGVGYEDGMKEQLSKKVVDPDYIVDRATQEARLSSDSLRPIMIAEFGSAGIRRSQLIYYTLYKVVR
jgi:hypothetical protein